MFRNRYSLQGRPRRQPRTILLFAVIVLAFLLTIGLGVRYFYRQNLGPVNNNMTTQQISIETGMVTTEIASLLADKGLIRNQVVFQWYVRLSNASDKIMAGTYELYPAMTTPQIVEIITNGEIATDLVTIYPGRRIDQIRQSLIEKGFDEASVDRALNPDLYNDHPVLVGKPASASLEGFLYPESFQRDSETTPETVIRQSLDEMNDRLTSEIRAAFAKQGLTVYQGVIVASIVEQEADTDSDRAQIAQVFLTRLQKDMQLGSDVTAFYGAIVDEVAPSVRYDSPYNTRLYKGFPPTPISNVSESSLRAIAFPANTDWLYFVAGDDGKTYFSRTLEEHERLTDLHCTTLCE